MKWQNLALYFIFFYLLYLLQSSFMPKLGNWAGSLDLIFLYFFFLVFFIKKNDYLVIAILALIAGFFLDILNLEYFGPSVIILLIIGLVFKKIQLALKGADENFSLTPFLSLFVLAWIVFEASHNYILNVRPITKTFLHLIFNLPLSALLFLANNEIYKFKKFKQ
jgi:hypothetical protein